IHESSGKALQIMMVTTVMVVILITWCTVTVLHGPFQVPPNPLKYGILLDHESLGWMHSLKDTRLSHLTMFILYVGFGHSMLVMRDRKSTRLNFSQGSITY